MAAEAIAHEVESASFGGDSGESMIPAFAIYGRPKRIDPNGECWRNCEGVIAELIGRTEPQPGFESGVASDATFFKDAIEGEFEATRSRAVISAPIHEPKRSWVVRIDSFDDAIDSGWRLAEADENAREQELRFWEAGVVLKEVWIAIPVSID